MRPRIFYCPTYSLIIAAYNRTEAQVLDDEHLQKSGQYHLGALTIIRLAPEEPQVINTKELIA